MSQAMLAEKAGLKPPAISQYESGVRSPNFESLVKLSNALGVPGDYLLMDQEDIIREDVGDALSRLIAHIGVMLDFEKREMLMDYALMLLKTKPSKSILPYFTDARAYAEHIFTAFGRGELPVDLQRLLGHLKVGLVEAPLADCEGMLVKGKENMIIIDPEQSGRQRQRFTIATLLGTSGHALACRHRLPGLGGVFFRHRRFPGNGGPAVRGLPADSTRGADPGPVGAACLPDSLHTLAGEKYDVSVFALANSLVDINPDKFAVIQSGGNNIIKTFQGTHPIREDLDPRSLAAGFMKNPPKEREIRTARMEEAVWFRKGRPGAYVLEESVYNPKGKVLTLLTVP